MDWDTIRGKAGTAALVGFRMMPGPLKRTAVRVGAPSYTAGAVCVLEHAGSVPLRRMRLWWTNSSWPRR